MKEKFYPKFSFVLVLSLALILFLKAENAKNGSQGFLSESILDGLQWRCVGPANMGGRIDDFAVVESNPSIIYVGTASGGVWKTANNGVTWEPVFDDQTTSTIGDVTVSPSNPDIVWVGTGEPNNRQSSSWGDGVYKSTDGGRSWENMGLRDSHHIGRIVIHPTDPDIVYVAALGHLWGPNRERGLYKTTNGGKSWVKTKFINEDTGFVDVAMDPENPETLYAAAYQRRRRGWGFNGGGPRSGLYKTMDGGESWVLLSEGLPTGIIGRIGIYIYRQDPRIVYATIEHKEGGVFRSENKGLTWKKMSSTNPRPVYYSKIRIDPKDDQRIWVLGPAMYVSEDGGRTFRTDYVTRIHGDYHAMWINPKDSDHMIVGSDGGIYFSYDRGRTWDFVNSLPLGQFYEIGYDMRQPYFVYGGLQDNGCWGGPSATRFSEGITNEDWFRILGGDGFYVQVDPTDYTTIYAESQRGYPYRFDLKTKEAKSIRPVPEDESETYRFNWNSPLLLSPHNPRTIYYGGNKLFKSSDKGETWEASMDLTKQLEQDKLPVMGVLPDKNTLSLNDGITFYGDITTISESPLKEGLLYVGTDDGNLQVSPDGGKTWKNVINKVPGVAKNTYVSRVIASRFEEGRAYVTFDGHRNDDFKPYVFVTEDYGDTWRCISGNLPVGSTVNVIREHHRSPNLLFVGTERGAYFSIDRGKRWVRIRSNLPVAPVDDIAIHPQANDLIFGTHGRSIWILDDITPLEQFTEDVLNSKIYLFKILEATSFNLYNHKANLGHKVFVAPNPPYGAMINYYLKEKAKESVEIIIEDKEGNRIRELKGTGDAGINRITWDLRYAPSPQTRGEFSRSFRTKAPRCLPGKYMVTLKVSDQKMIETLKVTGDPLVDISCEDRRTRHDILYSLYKLYPVIHSFESTLNSIQRQISDVQETIKKIPDVSGLLSEEANAILAKTNDIQLELFGDPKLGWPGVSTSVRGNLVLLGRAIERYTGLPSQPQLRQIDKNSAQLKDLVNRINEIIEKDISKLNRLLADNKISHQISLEKIKISE